MPEGREGKLSEPFSFAFPPMSFHGAGGQAGAGFGGSLPSAAALLVYACKLCREDERTEFFFIHLRISVFPDQGVVFPGDLYNRRRGYLVQAIETRRGSALHRSFLRFRH